MSDTDDTEYAVNDSPNSLNSENRRKIESGVKRLRGGPTAAAAAAAASQAASGRGGDDDRCPPCRVPCQVSVECKWDVVRVMHALKQEWRSGETVPTARPRERAAVYLSLGPATVGRIWSEFQRTGTVTEGEQGQHSVYPYRISNTKETRAAVRTFLGEQAAHGRATSVRQTYMYLLQQHPDASGELQPAVLPAGTNYRTFLRYVQRVRLLRSSGSEDES